MHNNDAAFYRLLMMESVGCGNISIYFNMMIHRYLIVFDDIYDVNSWERIKCALVDSGRGSGVVTSTKVLDVAKTATPSVGAIRLRLVATKDHAPEMVLNSIQLFAVPEKAAFSSPMLPI